MEIVVGNYKAKNCHSLLDVCEKVRSDLDGMLHSGIIHYIQSKMPNFILKVAIKSVLDDCPKIWPLDLPEQIEQNPELSLTPEMINAYEQLNKGLLVPIGGCEIVEIIKLGKQFLSEAGQTN